MNQKQTATWIWYPGDFEIWLHEVVSVRRQLREKIYPPMWRVDSCFKCVEFEKQIDLSQPETIRVYAEGDYNVKFGYSMKTQASNEYLLPAGKNTLTVQIYNPSTLPCLYIEGDTVRTDDTWGVREASNRLVPVAYNNFNSIEDKPTSYRLSVKEQAAVNIDYQGNTLLCDFGKETFGYLKLHNVQGAGLVRIYYGESLGEALSDTDCILTDTLDLQTCPIHVISDSRAFRYARVVPDENVTIQNVSMDYEYLDISCRGNFRCSNQRLNEIWDCAQYTLHLNTREFLIDGIKRDRWVWSGDAIQTALMNYYSFFDPDVNKRTMIALRGKDPVTGHMNTIVDYSLYWILMINDYLLYTGDTQFVVNNYEKAVSLMQFCLDRRNENGFLIRQDKEWLFIDWADIDNEGEVSTIQLLLSKSLDVMSHFSQMVGNQENTQFYQGLAKEIHEKAMSLFWDNKKKAFVHQRLNGMQVDKVTRYPNMFALLFGYLDGEQKEWVKQNVLLNDDVQKITTPYMRFYELAALCEIGEHDYVTEEMLNYWGGMLDLGATSFWETYDPNQSGAAHYEMYGDLFGKSLCHGWGATPIYLLGKYYLGITPITPGFETYRIQPELGGLEWIKGSVPMPKGDIHVYMDRNTIKVHATEGKGELLFTCEGTPTTSVGYIEKLTGNQYRLEIEKNCNYSVTF